MKIHPLVKEILITTEEIDEKCFELGQQISHYYLNEYPAKDNTILCLGLLKGCIPFMAKFIAHLVGVECETEYMVVSSYFGGVKSKDTPQILLDLPMPITNRDILLVEDIIDSGKTIKMIKDYLYLKGARSVKVVTLLDKKAGRKINLVADWYGFDVPPAFLIGFGLDYQERLRNLPYIAIADQEKLATWKWDIKK
ncbi:hypoxanthine phosphoribosyltransferase [Spiroplasma citri]|uniref:Hypoxanthine phosphoribosyltransferase n=1 Tax=Spiroplasma citri TaxID=2133 RepID=A0AAJ4EK86_SPICI|nr:hypoxanthine phosphoribosyltransferase [Spiroplasma citri]APE75380.1 putative hypoxanthine phosphoribosyltransferase [Spiroplasma citri]QED25256.1 hypoxanthine phosphoribosyltransferase [Spiroplasma citri]QIA67595.1 hypoxanthine phosphoribosyltransferase [Spiroplasma citri]QIA69445.1 hypoxanthine phosphoribosyltransferase [Spiroplasma citri]QIA71310.1 hypoxanthine phosphoribosyltransferase [Spiroplasma citri]